MTPLAQHIENWKDCQQCPLAQQRFRICLGRGTIPCDVLFCGEAPGAVEDVTGQVFTGPAGYLLDQIIERVIPATVTHALTNLVACFPREAKSKGENEPEYSEIMACRSRLIEFINVCQPRLIVCVGALAEEYVPHRMSMRYHRITHPAAILRMPLAKKQMETQRSIVTLRSAVEEMLAQPRQAFTPWESEHAGSTERQQFQQQFRKAVRDQEELPF